MNGYDVTLSVDGKVIAWWYVVASNAIVAMGKPFRGYGERVVTKLAKHHSISIGFSRVETGAGKARIVRGHRDSEWDRMVSDEYNASNERYEKRYHS
jgi:hypothetical protein